MKKVLICFYKLAISKLIQILDMEVDEEEDQAAKRDLKVYLPGLNLEQGEELEVDNSAYQMLHSLSVKWPCLSFDVLPDKLGTNRSKFPMTAYAVAGTQADKPKNNEVMILKMSQLCKTLEEEEDNDDMDDEEEDDPILESKSIPHFGGVNRVRASVIDGTNVAATWSDTGKVHLFNLNPYLTSLNVPGHVIPKNASTPFYTLDVHSDEGFAMDWSTLEPGKLLTGDFNGEIYMTDVSANGVIPDPRPFKGHQSSIEDLQWSPSEKNVFASCSADQTVRIWDVRNKNNSAISVHAHTSDVNVISWNSTVNYLLASGSDDGTFSVWDLRTFSPSAKPTPVASFKWHTAPITSIEWHPSDDSVLAVAGADDQVTLWDLSVEPDEENQGGVLKRPDGSIVPPQLLFIHQGQQDIKEIHWHKQIPGLMMSTAGSGFNIFKTISV
jgi:ribosome assembly protein RRB1